MAAATVTARQAELEARWGAVTSRMIEQEHDGARVYSHDMSSEYYKFQRIVQQWAVRTYGDHVWEGDEDAFEDMTSAIFEDAHRRIIAWAESQDAKMTARFAPREVSAA